MRPLATPTAAHLADWSARRALQPRNNATNPENVRNAAAVDSKMMRAIRPV
ncbi:MAG: hypothetical protein RLZZ395_2437, partial [Pseudomonadota bacterium]